jgi:hypothetical protein
MLKEFRDTMRSDEEFVARALVQYLGGPCVASAAEGEDPPDLYLSFGTSRVGVEVTRLSEFTFEPDGTRGNRQTQDSFGLRLIEDLNTEIGPLLPAEAHLFVGLSVPVRHAARFRKGLNAFVRRVALNPKIGSHEEMEIDGSEASVTVITQCPSAKKIGGYVANENSSAHIGLNCRLILDDRIRTKSAICEKLPPPIWLAMLNDYWITNGKSYELEASNLSIKHCFQRLLLVSDGGVVTELKIGA